MCDRMHARVNALIYSKGVQKTLRMKLLSNNAHKPSVVASAWKKVQFVETIALKTEAPFWRN